MFTQTLLSQSSQVTLFQGEGIDALRSSDPHLLEAIRLNSERSLEERLERWLVQHLTTEEEQSPLKDYSHSLQSSYVELSADQLGEKGCQLQEIIQGTWPHLRLKFHLIPKSQYQAFTLTNPIDYRSLFGDL